MTSPNTNEPAGERKEFHSSRQVGLSAVNAGDQVRSQRLALRISRRWAQVAPVLRLSLPAGTDLETFRVEHSEWLIGLLRAGLSLERIVRNGLDEIRLCRSDREKLLEEILRESADIQSQKAT